MPSSPVITLTTDFGLSDGYVAAIKGVILGLRPGTVIVDLCHAIPPQDIASAAYLLKSTCPYFPAGTIHLVVVDPGVGGRRDMVLLASGGHYFLAPDNGVLSLLLDQASSARRLARPDLYRQPLTATFHGRDLLAPLAAHLAGGLSPTELGPQVPIEALSRLPAAAVDLDPAGRRLRGRIIHIDHFGNLITNIRADDLRPLAAEPGRLCLDLGQRRIVGLSATYCQVPTGQALALINSNGQLEIAVNQGHAGRELMAGISDLVLLSVC